MSSPEGIHTYGALDFKTHCQSFLKLRLLSVPLFPKKYGNSFTLFPSQSEFRTSDQTVKTSVSWVIFGSLILRWEVKANAIIDSDSRSSWITMLSEEQHAHFTHKLEPGQMSSFHKLSFYYLINCGQFWKFKYCRLRHAEPYLRWTACSGVGVEQMFSQLHEVFSEIQTCADFLS